MVSTSKKNHARHMKIMCWVGSAMYGMYVIYIYYQYQPWECPITSEGQWMKTGAKTDLNTSHLLVLQCLFKSQLQMDVDHLREFTTLVAMKLSGIIKNQIPIANITHLLVKYNKNKLHY